VYTKNNVKDTPFILGENRHSTPFRHPQINVDFMSNVAQCRFYEKGVPFNVAFNIFNEESEVSS